MWQYKVETIHDYDEDESLETQLNIIGMEGWELIECILVYERYWDRDMQSHMAAAYTCVFRRIIPFTFEDDPNLGSIKIGGTD